MNAVAQRRHCLNANVNPNNIANGPSFNVRQSPNELHLNPQRRVDHSRRLDQPLPVVLEAELADSLHRNHRMPLKRDLNRGKPSLPEKARKRLVRPVESRTPELQVILLEIGKLPAHFRRDLHWSWKETDLPFIRCASLHSRNASFHNAVCCSWNASRFS